MKNELRIEWHYETRKIDDLKPYHKNPRRINKDQLEHLKKNLSKFGLIDKPFINTDNIIIGGHQRLRILKRMGYEEITVQVPDRILTEKEVEELNYRHNENGGNFDYDILANQYDHLDLINWGEDPLKKEAEEGKKSKAKAIFEFENKEELELASNLIQQAALDWGATLKVKV